MRPKDLIACYGSAASAAHALDVSHVTVHRWIKNGFIPLWSQYAIQAISGRDLMASKRHVIPPMKHREKAK